MARYLMDVSAYVRSGHPDARAKWEDLVESDSLLCHPVFAVELLHTAINPDDYRRRRDNLDKAFDWVWPNQNTGEIAVELQRAMATGGPSGQRVKTADLLIAALAVQSAAGVLHYDADYDAIRDRGGASFESEWLAEKDAFEGAQGLGARPRKAYSKAFQERMVQLQYDDDLIVWPRVIELMDAELTERGLDLPPPPDVP